MSGIEALISGLTSGKNGGGRKRRNDDSSNGQKKAASNPATHKRNLVQCYHCGEHGHRVPECPVKKMATLNTIQKAIAGQSLLKPVVDRVSNDVTTLSARLATTAAELTAARLDIKELKDVVIVVAKHLDAEIGRIKADLEKLGNPPVNYRAAR